MKVIAATGAAEEQVGSDHCENKERPLQIRAVTGEPKYRCFRSYGPVKIEPSLEEPCDVDIMLRI